MANFLSNSRGTTWLLIALSAFLALMTMANFYLLMETRNAQPATEQEALLSADAPPPIFVRLGPLTVNLRNDAYGQRLLYTSLTLRVDDEATQEVLSAHMPEVHSRLLLLLSAQNADDMTSVDGKAILSEKILTLFEQPFTDPQPPLAISAVLFTDFIVQ